MANVANRVYVIHCSLVVVWSHDFAVLGNLNSDLFQANALSLSTPSDSEQNSIKSVLDLVFSLFESDYFSALRIQSDFRWDGLFDKFNPNFFHVNSDFVGHMLIKSS